MKHIFTENFSSSDFCVGLSGSFANQHNTDKCSSTVFDWSQNFFISLSREYTAKPQLLRRHKWLSSCNVSQYYVNGRTRFLISTVTNRLGSFLATMEVTIIKVIITTQCNPSACHVSNIYVLWDGGTNPALWLVHKNFKFTDQNTSQHPTVCCLKYWTCRWVCWHLAVVSDNEIKGLVGPVLMDTNTVRISTSLFVVDCAAI